jgi:predicted metal-dependent enzyme (double-stranded beta helix superfamily)
VAVFDLDGFVTDCRSALREATAPVAVKELVERAISRPSDLEDALTPPTQGGFCTLHRSAELTVLQFVWPPRVVLFPHDHRMWAANGIYGGGEDNTFYRRTGSGICVSGGRRLDAGDVALLGADAIHAVTNPYGSYTAAIHVYGGDYFATPRSQWDAVSLEEQPFNVEDVRRTLDEADARAHDAARGHGSGGDAAAPRPPAGADPEAGARHG